MPDLVEPAVRLVPEHVGTYGPVVADWADSCGLSLDAEQRLVLDGMYAYGPRGELVATEAGVVCARQNLKTHVLLTAALADLFVFGEPGCMWTAHMRPALVDPTSGAFAVCKRVIESNDHLRRYVRNVSEADGEEGIELVSGASLAFRTRSGRSGRALTGRRITLDEALYLNGATLGALVPVLSAQSMNSDVQLRYGSSAGKAESAVLRGVRDRGRAGRDRRLFYVEWSAPRRPCAAEECAHEAGTPGCALDDPVLLQQANPALGRRISLDFVLGTERSAMTPEEFGRERLGWWDEPAGADLPAIDPARWADLVDASPPAESRCSWGLAVAPDRSWSALAVAFLRPDSAAQVLLIDYRPSTAWVRPRLDAALVRRPGPVHADVAGRGLFPGAEQPSSTLQAEAHAGLADAVMAGRGALRTGGEAAVAMSLRAARWRPQGDSRVLERKGDTDISPLAAIALALHGLRGQSPEAPLPITDATTGTASSETAFLSGAAF